jgi:hypothetical protein
MSIKYYPNRAFKKSVPAIDRVMCKRVPKTIRGSKNITSTGVDERITCKDNWQVDSIKINFDVETPKDYDIKVLTGVMIVKDLNDYLYFQSPNSYVQKITLSEGFYTGAELATELESKLSANTAFIALGITFSVSYSESTGVFAITPSKPLRYIDVTRGTLSERDSIAGFLFGLNQTTDYVSSIVSDSNVWGLGQESWIISESNAVAMEQYVDDFHILTMDQALHITSSTAGTRMDYEIVFEEIV